MKVADLHIHTHFSDSTSSPQEVIDDAKAQNLDCIAITDHDTIDGLSPTREAAKAYNIEVISGVELSSDVNGRDVHILGYLFDDEDQEFVAKLNEMQLIRVSRMQEMIEKLKTLGINNIELQEVCDLAKSKSVGRPHLAAVLKEKGWVVDIRAAFDKYLAEGAAAYVPKFKLAAKEGIELIHKAGGVAVMAHPMITNMDEIIPGLAKAGLDGIEVHYPYVSETTLEFYKNLAQKHNLLITGGSDAHGKAKKTTFVGKIKIPYELVEKMKSYKSK